MQPDIANEHYGPHEAQVLDLWHARADAPTPLLCFIHGGGFQGGSKDSYDKNMLKLCLDHGISYAAIEYRLTPIGPYPMQHHDCACAIQHLRHHAKAWNLDPARIASSGESAGAGLSQWLGFHDDLADPNAKDPIARQSTRIRCAIVFNAQCTYDPREIEKIVPGNAYDCGAIKRLFGVPQDWDWRKDAVTPAMDKQLKDCGPLSLLNEDACPVFFMNKEKNRVDGNIHHPNFGEHFKKVMDERGLECVRHMDTDFAEGTLEKQQAMLAFAKKYFGMSA